MPRKKLRKSTARKRSPVPAPAPAPVQPRSPASYPPAHLIEGPPARSARQMTQNAREFQQQTAAEMTRWVSFSENAVLAPHQVLSLWAKAWRVWASALA